ncbi:MAG: hypothetical protein M3Q80_00510 [bacterium]|nr:hypothetical protein [bacterium]
MKLYICAFVVVSIVLGAHIFGLKGLYIDIPTYDIMMHMIGGVGIALFLSALFQSYKTGEFFSAKNIVVGVFIIGIIWEYFEIHFGLLGHPLWSKLYYIDTVADIINDIIGGSIVAYVVTRKNRKLVLEKQVI